MAQEAGECKVAAEQSDSLHEKGGVRGAQASGYAAPSSLIVLTVYRDPSLTHIRFTHLQTPVYSQRVSQMCSQNMSSLEVSFIHLSEDEPQLAIFLADAPADMLEILSSVATR